MKRILHSLLAAGLGLGWSVSSSTQARAEDYSAYTGQIKAFGFSPCPELWLPTNGQLLQINDYHALANLIGTSFGGDGQTTFALPDLQGRFASMAGPNSPPYSTRYGQSSIRLRRSHLPGHSHALMGSHDRANSESPQGRVLGSFAGVDAYATETQAGLVALANGSIGTTGQSAPMSIQDPYITLNFCINTNGVFPVSGAQ